MDMSMDTHMDTSIDTHMDTSIDTHMDMSIDTHMDMSMDIHMEMPIKSKVSEIENAKGRCPKTPAQRLTGDAFRGTPPVSAISPKKSLRTALKMGRS